MSINRFHTLKDIIRDSSVLDIISDQIEYFSGLHNI